MSLIDFGRDPPRYRLVAASSAIEDADYAFLDGWLRSSKAEPKFDDIDLVVFTDSDAPAIFSYKRLDRRLSLLPKIALVTPGKLSLKGVDDSVNRDLPTDVIRRRMDVWRPTPDARRFGEIARGFGNTALRPIARALSDQLQRAIVELDAESFDHAHRIAGIAGTLGFKRVSDAWLAIDHGDLSDLSTARREARLAVVALERWLAA